MHIRFQAHWSPYNSGLLAGEALVRAGWVCGQQGGRCSRGRSVLEPTCALRRMLCAATAPLFHALHASGPPPAAPQVAPFFGAGRVQHAKLPVCVEQAFPRSGA